MRNLIRPDLGKVVKYCNKETLNYLLHGSFKIGTLEEYRTSEMEAARMSDRQEGIANVLIGQGSGRIERLELPNGGVIEDCTFENCGAGVYLTTHYNEYIFCCTIGEYRKSHHEVMLTGSNTEYEGNKDLEYFVELDLSAFLKALKTWAEKTKGVLKNGSSEAYLYSRPVTYNDRTVEMSTEWAQATSVEERNSLALTRAVFSKPGFFAPEQEYRINLRISGGYNGAPFGASALFPKSHKLKMAIKRYGRFGGSIKIPRKQFIRQ